MSFPKETKPQEKRSSWKIIFLKSTVLHSEKAKDKPREKKNKTKRNKELVNILVSINLHTVPFIKRKCLIHEFIMMVKLSPHRKKVPSLTDALNSFLWFSPQSKNKLTARKTHNISLDFQHFDLFYNNQKEHVSQVNHKFM